MNMRLLELVSNIFGSHCFQELKLKNNESINCENIEIVLKTVKQHISNALIKEKVDNINESRKGRLGPDLVRLDTSTHHGQFIVTPDRLSVNSQSNFSTIRANTGVYEGKWMYEVQLGSKGVMQLGWSTMQCTFNQESGVGDVINSYAYDGNRVRKWNVSTHKYGEAWLSGDIISSTIDLEKGTISFYRNGKNLGVAFENISMGPGIVYFPTVSLAFTENLTVNFGSAPMRYPVDSYQLLQNAPYNLICKSQMVFEWFEKLLHQYNDINNSNEFEINEQMNSKAILGCLSSYVLNKLGPFVAVPYITQDIFVPFIKKICNINNAMLTNCLNLMWTFLEKDELKICLEASIAHLSSIFRQVSAVPEYPEQCTVLKLLNNLCQDLKTRKYLLQYILFDKVKLANFLHIKPLDEECLSNTVSKVWWETNPTDSSIESYKTLYFNACDKIKFWTAEVEAHQVELLVTLLNNKDGDKKIPTSRALFLRKFRRFVQENHMLIRPIPLYQTPLPIALCCFDRLLVTFKILWDDEISSSPIYIPTRTFCDSTVDYSGIDRLGGVLSHLNKTFRQELIQLLGVEHASVIETENENSLEGAVRVLDSPYVSILARVINMNSANTVAVAAAAAAAAAGGSTNFERISYFPLNKDNRDVTVAMGSLDPVTSLIELLDGILLFYHTTAKKQIAKVANIRDVMTDYSIAMLDVKARLDLLINVKDAESQSIQAQLMKTIQVFDKKLKEQGRHMAWVRAVVYSKEKQERLVWLLKIVMLTLSEASRNGNLLSFVPEFYMDVLTDLITGLKSHMHPTVMVDNIPDLKEILTDIAQFVCDHFFDSRIVNANSKDTLILTLAGFVSNSMTLEALEQVSHESRLKMVSNLFKSYDTRAWAQSNWILVRFWQGHGFAFRYDKSPHISKKIGPKILNQESISQPIKPCPSNVFQACVVEVLSTNNQTTTQYINSLLNRLNWAFSEFIGMVQEIHNVSSRPERVFIESRQLKICATYFDLAVSLLRVLEMISSISPKVFCDFSLPSSENLLVRLCQLLCQILNRTSMQTSSFQHVVLLDIPDLQTVDHFPILTAVIGIFLALLKDDMSLPEFDEIPKITKIILNEPSFQMTSLYFVLGEVKNTRVKNLKPFSLLNYENHVSVAEINMVKKMLEYLDYYSAKIPLAETPCNDDDLCTICYAHPRTAIFKPCNHKSCHTCIDRHLLNNKNCFFCKSTISQVLTIDGKVLHELSGQSYEQDSMSDDSVQS